MEISSYAVGKAVSVYVAGKSGVVRPLELNGQPP